MVKISKITKKEAEKEISEKKARSIYQEMFKEIKETGNPVKVEELTRGQVAALYRATVVAGLKVRANYKAGYVVISA